MDIAKFAIASYVINLVIVLMMMATQASVADLHNTDSDNPVIDLMLNELGEGSYKPDLDSRPDQDVVSGGKEDTSAYSPFETVVSIGKWIKKMLILIAVVFVPIALVGSVLMGTGMLGFIFGTLLWIYQAWILWMLLKFVFPKRFGSDTG